MKATFVYIKGKDDIIVNYNKEYYSGTSLFGNKYYIYKSE